MRVYFIILDNYRNSLYWDARIKHAFWTFLDYGFNAASKPGNLGLNAPFKPRFPKMAKKRD